MKKNKGPTPWGGRGFLIIVVLEFKPGMNIIYIVVYSELFFRSMYSWYQHAQVNIWNKLRSASTLIFEADSLTFLLRFFVFSLHSSFWRVGPTPAYFCWFWELNRLDRTYSMNLAFKRSLYNVLTFLGSHDWRLSGSQLSEFQYFDRPLRNFWFRFW